MVAGVVTDILETLLERTLNALPPPDDRIAEALSKIEMSSRVIPLCAAISSDAASVTFGWKHNSLFLYRVR